MSTKRFGPFPGVFTQGENKVDPMVDNGAEWYGLNCREEWEKRAEANITFLSKWSDRLCVSTPWNQDTQTWSDRMEELIYSEKVGEIRSKVDFGLLSPTLEYWTRDGKVTRMSIHRPEKLTDYNNLNHWKVFLFFDEHSEEPLIKDVGSLMYEERYLIAWYALWRKWPMEYKVWKWAAGKKEVVNPLVPPNSSFWYKSKFEEWEANVGFRRIPRDEWLFWYPYSDPSDEDMLFDEDEY